MIKWNESQLEAINHKDGACAVIAGAGSGKSTVLIERIKKLIESGVDDNDILAISFTKNTSTELKNKLRNIKIKGVNVGTFHAICIQILSKEGVDCSRKLLDFEVENTFKKYNNNQKVDTNDIRSFISYQKNYNKTYIDTFEEKESNYSEEELRAYFKVYEELKQKRNAIDFDDMLIKCLDVLKKKPHKYNFKYILVDEHQDSNLVQNELIKLLCPSGNVFCVFDYRQAIYTFRGGNPEYCMNFKIDYPDAKIINLDINYRSCNNIVDKANNFIKKYYGNYEFYSDGIANLKNNGDIEVLTSYEKSEEAKTIVDNIEEKIKNGEKLNDIAILYRLNSHSSYVENELKLRNIDYYIDNGGSFFKRKEVEAVMSILRLVNNPNDDEAFEIMFKLGTRPIGFIKYEVLEDIKQFAAINNLSLYHASQLIKYKVWYHSKNMKLFDEYINKLSMQYKKNKNLKSLINNAITAFNINGWIETKYSSEEEITERIEALESLKEFIRSNTLESFITYVYSTNQSKKNTNKNCIKLMSIHKSKGLEFKNIYIIAIEDGKFPHRKSNLIDEARLFYVGITRAKENLYISQIYEDNLFITQYLNKERDEN